MTMHRDEHGEFYADRDELIEALRQVPDGARLYKSKNKAGGLSIVIDGDYVGYVDFRDGATVMTRWRTPVYPDPPTTKGS